MHESSLRVLVLKPPNELVLPKDIWKVFLAGSIEQGSASNWQDQVTDALSDRKILILNPRRDSWNSSWKQVKEDPQVRFQIEWELEAMERADKIIMYFDPKTLSPITLAELGLFASSGKLVVCCPSGFYRKANVDIICERYGVPMVENLEGLIAHARNAAPPT